VEAPAVETPAVEAPVVEATTPIEAPVVPEVEVAPVREAEPEVEVAAVEPAPVVEAVVHAPVVEEAAPAVREVREEQTAFQWTAEPAARLKRQRLPLW
jgi:ribonuclease E